MCITHSISDITPKAVQKATDDQLRAWLDELDNSHVNCDYADYCRECSIAAVIEEELELREMDYPHGYPCYCGECRVNPTDPRDQLDYPHNQPIER